MKRSRNLLFLAMSLALAVFLAACGSSSTGSGPYGSSSSASPTPKTSSSSATTIKSATMTVSGKSITALTNSQGMTLYYNTSDTATTTVCSGGCASIWPPLVSTSVPSTATALPGTLSLLTDANGSQVTYNGHPLYTYSGDTSPGQTNGNGISGVWFVAPTNLSMAAPAKSTPTPGGYNNNGY